MMIGANKGTDATCKRVPKNSIGVELGVWKGASSEKFLRRAKFMHLVDPWSIVPYEKSDEFGNYSGYLKYYSELVGSDDPSQFQYFYDKIYESVKKKFNGKPVKIHRCTTEVFFDYFIEKVDWVYIDALHSFDGCLFDLRNCLKIIKAGGLIFGDDYSKKKPGVKKAVDFFIQETGLTLNNFHSNQYEIKI